MNIDRLAPDQLPVTYQNNPVNDDEPGPKYSIKRFMFVASLYCWMNHIEKPTSSAMVELNDRFKLVKRSNALLFPAAMSKLVWGKVDLKSIHERFKERKMQIDEVVTELMDRAPNWVRYDDDVQLTRDVEQIFRSVPAV
jgi:hypothetical protein